MTSLTATGTPASAPASSPRAELFVHAPRRRQRPLGREMQVGVCLRVLRLGETQSFLGQFHGAELAIGQALAHPRHGERGDLGGCHERSITLGTLKNPAPASGALASAASEPMPGRSTSSRQRRGFPSLGKDLRHRLHSRRVESVQLLHVGEHLAQVLAHLRHFLVAEVQVGESGHISDFLFRELQIFSVTPSARATPCRAAEGWGPGWHRLRPARRASGPSAAARGEVRRRETRSG